MSEEKITAAKKVYSVGQRLVFTEDAELTKAFGTKEIVKKGTKVYVGAEERFGCFAHYLNGNIQKIGDDVEIKGYSVTGIAEWLYEMLSREFPLDEMLEEYDATEERFKECIEDALEELGMYDSTGNRS